MLHGLENRRSFSVPHSGRQKKTFASFSNPIHQNLCKKWNMLSSGWNTEPTRFAFFAQIDCIFEKLWSSISFRWRVSLENSPNYGNRASYSWFRGKDRTTHERTYNVLLILNCTRHVQINVREELPGDGCRSQFVGFVLLSWGKMHIHSLCINSFRPRSNCDGSFLTGHKWKMAFSQSISSFGLSWLRNIISGKKRR